MSRLPTIMTLYHVTAGRQEILIDVWVLVRIFSFTPCVHQCICKLKYQIMQLCFCFFKEACLGQSKEGGAGGKRESYRDKASTAALPVYQGLV